MKFNLAVANILYNLTQIFYSVRALENSKPVSKEGVLGTL